MRPEPSMTLTALVEAGVDNFLREIEAVSRMSSQEHALERALDKMKSDWSGVELECVSYKQTGTYVLHGMEDILTLLDEHLIKTQAMRVSPYRKPFEERIGAWEKQLICLQVISK